MKKGKILEEKEGGICPICQLFIPSQLKHHISIEHSDEELAQAVIKAKSRGMTDEEIGRTFGITFRKLEKIITEALGANFTPSISPRKIKRWSPEDFRKETTTVWSFKKRGDWATHNPHYRGNWSPYIPRNIILKYSQPGEVVLDYFVGGGTTAIEAKLLGRRCIARDINPVCVQITNDNLSFSPPQSLFSYPLYEPEVSVGDARKLSDIMDESIDLICAHPPYAGIINYSSSIEGDLSNLSFDDFLGEMQKVARESFRVLKRGGKCALLLGDARKRGHIVPLGFEVINIFLEAGFRLKELVIKRQHNCKTTGFWYEKSIKYNFLLLAHEYLPVFEKPVSPSLKEEPLPYHPPLLLTPFLKREIKDLESTSVWLFPRDKIQESIEENVFQRYGSRGKLLFFQIHSLPNGLIDFIREHLSQLTKGSYLLIQTRDLRFEGYIIPLAKHIYDILKKEQKLWLKEIIIVAPEDFPAPPPREDLEIIHQYLLLYEAK